MAFLSTLENKHIWYETSKRYSTKGRAELTEKLRLESEDLSKTYEEEIAQEEVNRHLEVYVTELENHCARAKRALAGYGLQTTKQIISAINTPLKMKNLLQRSIKVQFNTNYMQRNNGSQKSGTNSRRY